MIPRISKFALGSGILVLSLLLSVSLRAQDGAQPRSGTITSPSVARSSQRQNLRQECCDGSNGGTQTDSSGLYQVPNLNPGDYEIAVSAEGFSTNVPK